MEEVKKEEQTTIETLLALIRVTRKGHKSKRLTTEQKKHFHRRKRLWREESKKEHTGDALALRGDEGRDKLR